MKHYTYIFIAFLGISLFSCNTVKKASIDTSDYDVFGENFTVSDKLLTEQEALKKYESLSVNDSLHMQFSSSINEVCAKKGCFMILDLGEGESARIMFKDYGFFVPKDAAGREAIVNGWAYKKETSVERLQHYAEDAGKTPEEIAKITEPRIDYTFMADGVLMKK